MEAQEEEKVPSRKKWRMHDDSSVLHLPGRSTNGRVSRVMGFCGGDEAH
ncbi:Peroxidase [Psidium guajava]|nr:Peroxidase [Psidium guajava]